MAHSIPRFALAALAFGAFAGPVPAETAAPGGTVTPDVVSYEATASEDDGTRVCQIVLDAANDRDGEILRFVVLLGFGAVEREVLSGFVMAVGDRAGEGERADVRPVRLASVAFSGHGFESAGRLAEEAFDHGSILATTGDADTGLAFLDAFMAGDYRLSFARADAPEAKRLYHILPGPPEPVKRAFEQCAGGAPIGADALAIAFGVSVGDGTASGRAGRR